MILRKDFRFFLFLTALVLTTPFSAAKAADHNCPNSQVWNQNTRRCTVVAAARYANWKSTQIDTSHKQSNPPAAKAKKETTKPKLQTKQEPQSNLTKNEKTPPIIAKEEPSDSWLGNKLTEIKDWAHTNPKTAGFIAAAGSGILTYAITGNPIAAGAVAVGVGATVTTAANGSLAKAADTIEKVAKEHPVITGVVSGVTAGVATLLITKNLPAAAIAGVAIGTSVTLTIDHFKKPDAETKPACPPDNKTPKPGPGKGKTPKKHSTKTPAPAPTPTVPTPDKKPDCKDLKNRLTAAQNALKACNVFTSGPAFNQLKEQAGGDAVLSPPATAAPVLVKSETAAPPPAATNKCDAAGLSQEVDKLKAVAKTQGCVPAEPTPAPPPSSPIIVTPPTNTVPALACSSCPVAGKTPNKDSGIDLSKLPWKGMGIVGAYGGLLGSLLLGPIGMFVFGVIGIGLGYILTK